MVVKGPFEDAEAMTTSSQSRNLSEAYSDRTVVTTCLPFVPYMCLISGLELTVAVPSNWVISSLEGKFGTVSETCVQVLERLFMKI